MSYQNSNNAVLSLTNSTTTQTAIIDCTQLDVASLQAVYTNGTTSAKTFTSGLIEVDTFTLPTLLLATDGDYMVWNDVSGAAWAIALDTTGGAANTPTGAAWVAIPAANKKYLDISGTTTATTVATAVYGAAILLTGETTYNTTTHSNATVINTQVFAGVVTAPTCYSKSGASGTGSITVVVSTAGTASKLNPLTNVVTITAHGQTTGSLGQMTTSSALPTGLSTSTDYYLIVLSANTVQFASTLAHAQSGTAITLTTSGVGTQTFTPTSLSQVLKVSVSNDSVSPTNWTDIPGTTVTITSAGSTYWSSLTTYIASSVTNPQLDCSAKFMRVVCTPTSGQLNLTVTQNTKSLTRN